MLGVRDLFVVAPASSLHHHHHAAPDHHAALGAAATGGAAVGVIPLLAAAPCAGAEDRKMHPHHHMWAATQGHYGGRNSIAGPAAAADGEDSSFPGAAGGGGAAFVGTTCQDCGNQAKKDCSHRRCRTCCKSRGFDCPTHVKSTWVPAARRRERQLAAASGSAASTSTTKKPRLISSQTTTTTNTTPSHTSTSNTTAPRSFDSCSSHQDASFRESLPGQIRAPAVFKCVRVTSMDDGEDEYAYQAVVKIGGHVFKGFLYDQGEEGKECLPNISDLHLGGPSSLRDRASSSFPVLDPADVYAASGGGLVGGTGFGNPLN